MPTMVPTNVTTAEELLTLREPGYRHELVRGELRRMSNAGWWHGAVAAAVCEYLRAHVRQQRLGLVFAAETGFLLTRDPDTVRSPDAAFVATQRLPEAWGRGHFVGAPDLAVEVTSPNDRFADVHEKALCWLEYGTRLVWVVEPEARRVSVYHHDRTITIVDGDRDLSGEDVLTDFRLPLTELFADPR